MSLMITTDVSCDGYDCLEWTHGSYGTRTKAKRAREAARAAGWSRVRIDGRKLDLCPRCLETRRKGGDNR